MFNRKPLCLFLVVAATGCAAAWSDEPGNQIRLVIGAERSPKLAQELVAAKLSGGRLIGRTEDGRAVVETAIVDAKVAQESISQIEGISSADTVVPEEFEVIDRLIVGYEPGERPAAAGLEAAGLQIVEVNEEGSFIVVSVVDGIQARTLGILEADASVSFVEPDYVVTLIPPPEGVEAGAEAEEAEAVLEAEAEIEPARVPNDSEFAKLWGMRNIRAPAAWNTVTSSPVVVAVVDTGVDYNHEDLRSNMWTNPKEKPGDGKDNDGNGIIDDVYGADFVNNDGDPMDDNRHGTHCAGTIGAVGNNGKGVAGVNWSVKIMALKFLSAGGYGNISNAIKCVQYARKKGARVLSNSWGGGGYSKAMANELTLCEKAGILFVAAAGNSEGDNDKNPHYPSSYSHANIIAVAAIDTKQHLSYYSCFGKNSVDIAAPGGDDRTPDANDIYSTMPANKYGFLAGTSMATPHVSGAAALLWGHVQYRGASWKTIKSLLMKNARPLKALAGKCVTGGTLDIGFLEPAITTCCAVEAYTDFYNRPITKTQTLASLTFELSTTMFAHITAQTTARLQKASKANNIVTGLYTKPVSDVIFTRSLRRAHFEAIGDIEPISTSFGLRMPPGRHTIYWNVWPYGTQLLTGSGTIMVEGFGVKRGGILEVGEEEAETAELMEDGTIKRQVIETIIETP